MKRTLFAALVLLAGGIIAFGFSGKSNPDYCIEPSALPAVDTPIVNEADTSLAVQPDTASDAHKDVFSERVTICHRGRLISVSRASLPVHLGHGDRLGSCE